MSQRDVALARETWKFVFKSKKISGLWFKTAYFLKTMTGLKLQNHVTTNKEILRAI